MNLRKVINRDVVAVNMTGGSKREIIENLLNIIVKTGKVKDRESALSAILEREDKMSTGIQNGIAIPHGKTTAVEELVACVGIIPEGVDFRALDGEPSRIFVMTLSPEGKTGPHVQFLAEISRLLTKPDIREKMLNSTSEDELVSLLLKGKS